MKAPLPGRQVRPSCAKENTGVKPGGVDLSKNGGKYDCYQRLEC